MDMSFYTAATGAGAHQTRLDITANNLAHTKTYGFKATKPVFSDMLYNNFNGVEGQGNGIKVGSGTRVEKADTSFDNGGFYETGEPLDFAINGSGFFGLYNPETKEIAYTRSGNFIKSQKNNKFYLASKEGYLVLDPNQKPIVLEGNEEMINIGIFDFAKKNGMLSEGGMIFSPVGKNGNVQVVKDSVLEKGKLETSNVDITYEFAKVIEVQRAYQYALKMVQTSDEIEGFINNLR